MRPRATILALALLAALGPTRAHAQASASADDEAARRERALALYHAARTLDSEGRTEEALPLSEEAYRLYPSAGARYAMGLLHERLGDRDEAVRHYRMALAEERAASPDLARSIEAALARLDAPTTPLPPEPLPGTEAADPDPELPRPGGALETPSATPTPAAPPDAPSDPVAPPDPEPTAVAHGLRLGLSGFGDLVRLDASWGFGAALGWVFDVGAFVQLEVNGPHPTFLLAGGVEIGDLIVRPIVAALVGVSPVRTFSSDQTAAVFVGPRLGAALYPAEGLPLSVALTVSLAIDLTRASDGFVFTLPMALSARWVFE